MMTQMQVHLYRDSFTTPWGIRLQGGKDLTSPLVIQRVFPNTPAAGYLHRGDILLSLNGKDASGLTHKQAQDVFQFAGGQIPLIIRRPHIESREAPPSQQQERQTYRTVPLDLEGPTKMAHPHVPKGGMKYGGGGPSYGVSYTPPGGVQRQSSKPWEDNEMLHKVQDTLSHKSYPYQQVSSYNGGPPVHYQPVAPPAYIPGPPESSGDANYIDPFPSYVPQKPSEEEEDDYEFLPVSQRRNQFSKHDFAPETKKPIRSRSRPQTFSAPPPAPRPVVQPVYAPISRPAEGQVIQDETPPWAGTLSNASGAKMWDVGMQPTQHVSPTRSVSPSKKRGKKPPAPKPTQEFSPTKTQALDFSNDPEDGPRIMHLQYNSPLDMYSRQNVQETLQGQTQAALGGGNTAKWLGDVEYENPSSQSPAQEYGPVKGSSSSRSNISGAATSVRESRASPCKTPVRYPSPLKMVDSPTSSFYYPPPPLQSPEPVAYDQHHSPIRHVEPPRRAYPQAPSPQPTYNPPQTYEDVPSPSFLTPKQWAPVTPPVQTYNPPVQTYVPPPPPPPPPAWSARGHLPFTPTVPETRAAKRAPSAAKPRQHTTKSAPSTPATGESVPDYSYRSWGASIISPFAKKLEQEQAEQSRDEPVHEQTAPYTAPILSKEKPGSKKHMVFEELSSALKKSSTFPRGTYAAKEFEGNGSTTVFKSGTSLYSHVQYTHSYEDNGNNNSESDPGYVTPPTSFENYGEKFEAVRAAPAAPIAPFLPIAPITPVAPPKTVSTGIVMTFSNVPPAGVVSVEQPAKEDPSVIAVTPFTIDIKPLVSDVTAVTPQEKPVEIPASETTAVVEQPTTTTEEPQKKEAETVQQEAETVQEAKQEIIEEAAPPAPPVDKESSATTTEAAAPAEGTGSVDQVDKVTETKTETATPPEGDTAVAPVESATKTETPATPEAAPCAVTQADTNVQSEEKEKDVSPVANEVKEVEKEAATQPDASSTETAPVDDKVTSTASQEEVHTVQESETAKTTTETASSEVQTTDGKVTVTSETSVAETAAEPTATTKTETTVETTTKTTPTAESVVETTVTTTTVTEKTETVEHGTTEHSRTEHSTTEQSRTESSTSEEHSAAVADDKPEAKTPEGVEEKIEASSCPPAAASKTEEPAAETAASSTVPADVKEQPVGDQGQVTTLVTPTPPSEPTPTVVETSAQESQPVEKLVSDGEIAAPTPREGETTTDTQTVKNEGCPSVNQTQSEDTSNKITTEIPASDTTTTTITTITTTTTTDTTETTANVTAAAAEDATSSADKALESNNSGAVVDPVVVSN